MSTANRNAALPARGAPSRCRVCAGVAVVAVWLSSLSLALGQQPLSDQQMKAAYVLNFIRYTDWPEKVFTAQDASLTVCVLGDPSATGLAGIAGKSVKGRALQIRAVASAEDARSCHALFVPELDTRRFVGTLRALHNMPVLTIGEADGFVDIGGMIGLVHFDSRLQFEVNLGVMKQAQLKASSQVLRLARNVIETQPH